MPRCSVGRAGGCWATDSVGSGVGEVQMDHMEIDQNTVLVVYSWLDSVAVMTTVGILTEVFAIN